MEKKIIKGFDHLWAGGSEAGGYLGHVTQITRTFRFHVKFGFDWPGFGR